MATLDEGEISEHVTPPSNTNFIAAMLSPSIVLFLTGIAVPLLLAIYLSFAFSSGKTPIGPPRGLYNYVRIFKPRFWEGDPIGRFSPEFYRYFYQTVFFVVVTVTLEFLIGLAFALILNEDFRGRTIVRTAVLIPWAIPTVVSATFFLEIFAPVNNFGVINNIIEMFGGTPIPFYGESLAVVGENKLLLPLQGFPFIGFESGGLDRYSIKYTYTMLTVIAIEVWKTTPFIALLILAGLQTIPNDLYKAADVQGASIWQKFRYVTWPNVKGPAIIAILFRTINAIRIYDSVVVFNDESVYSLTVLAVETWELQRYGVASAIAIVALALVAIAAFILFKGNKKVYTIAYVIFFTMFHYWIWWGLAFVIIGSIYYGITYYLDKYGPKSEEYKFDPESVKYVRLKRNVKKGVFYSITVFLVAFALFPFLWVLNRSFRNPCRNRGEEICQTTAPVQNDFELFPEHPGFQSYDIIFNAGGDSGVSFTDALINGFFLSATTAIIVVIIGSLVGAVLSKYRFQGQNAFVLMIFAMSALPPIIIIVPYLVQINAISPVFEAIFGVGIRETPIGSLLPLILPYVAFNLPLGVFLLQSFFNEIPDDLISAAKVDGASNFQIFRKILLPLTAPGIFTTAMMVFIYAWNELLFARMFLIGEQDRWTVPLAILQFSRTGSEIIGIPYTPQLVLAAASIVATVPLIVLVMLFQKQLVQGITQGAVKG